MDLQKLRYFVVAARTLNFRKAAEQCMVAQPVLSRQIAALEAELGVRLFKREKQRVSLTFAGEQYVAYAQAALEQLHEGQQAMQQFNDGSRGVLEIGCVEPLVSTLLAPSYSELRRMYPGIQLHVQVRGAHELMQLVEQGSIEVGVFGLPLDQTRLPTSLVMRELFRDRLHLVVASKHPLAQHRNRAVLLEQIAHEPLVLLRHGFGIRSVVERVWKQRGYVVQGVVEIDLIAGVLEFVRQGVGVGFIPPALLPITAEKDLTVIPIADMVEEFTFGLLYRQFETLSPATHTFIQKISENTRYQEAAKGNGD